MRARLLRSSLIAAAVGVLLVGLPVLALAGWETGRQTEHDLGQRADDILVVLQARRDEPLADLRGQVMSVLAGGRRGGQMHAVVLTPEGRLDVGPTPDGPVIQRQRLDGQTTVTVELAQSELQADVAQLALVILALSVVAFVLAVATALLQARRLVAPLAVLADNADRLGRGESRLRAVRSGVPELDRVAAGLARSAESMAAALAAERDFASDASHQLRTPLTALSMRLEEISTSQDLDEVQEEARIALNQVERLTQVVDSLLARSRRTRRTTIAPLELKIVLDQQIEEWSPAFREKRRRLVLQPVEPVRVVATPGALTQVLATLVENSLQHGQGIATITARRTGRSVVVEVTDEGEGVPPSLGSRVFERTVSSSGSTGLGLALARDLAEADGGRLELVRARPPVFALFLNAAAD
ncbi:two-component system sensor histidine kinase DraK [Angustibacter peucedani]